MRQPDIEVYATAADAIATLRRLARGRSVRLHCSQDAKSIPLQYGTETSACVAVTAKSAEAFIRSAYIDRYPCERRGGLLVRFVYSTDSRLLFIGGI